LLREKKGRSIGIVSTVPFSHATPAAHVSHNVSRNNYAAIADEIIRTVQPEVVIGGGLGTSYLSSALYSDLKAGNIPAYRFVERQSGVDGALAVRGAALAAAAEGKKLFGLFGGSGGNFESPVPTDDGSAVVERSTIENPLLKDAALAALTVLGKNPKGFFLMLEQGDIDWSNHANDYKRMIGTMWDLEECVRSVIDDITWKNTLVIVTADHGNSYMRLNEDKGLGAGDLPEQNGTSYPGGEVTYASTEHTNELVTLYAMGNGSFRRVFHEFEGSWYPRTRIIDNTQLFHIMMKAAGCTVEPQLSINENVSAPAGLSMEESN
jgi:alkaline phosphatase